MKILVAVKRVVDYNVKVHVLADHSGLDIATAKMSMNPFDEIAVEQAVRFKEKGVADEVVAVSIGAAKTVDTLRVALAMGADRAIHVNTDAMLDPADVARTLAQICEKETPDMVLLGAGSGRHAGRSSHKNELALERTIGVKVDFSLIPPVGFEFGVRQPPFVSKVINTLEFSGLCNFNIRKHEILR